MKATQSTISRLHNPTSDQLGADHTEFLNSLSGPTWLTLDGEDSSRRRAIVTLLHGNEPSGLHAIHDLLAKGVRPATDLGVMIASVDAATHPPVLSHRFLPEEKDLNRCFSPPYITGQDHLARNILTTLHEFSPEAVVDTHNTSSHSEPFCVALNNTEMIRQLAALFTDRLVIVDKKMGTLLEHIEVPVLTVEFGGFMDPNANRIAAETLRRFITMDDLSQLSESRLTCLEHPLRLETGRHLTVSYSSSLDEHSDLTMINTIDQLNFKRIDAGVTLGWFREMQHRSLIAQDRHGQDLYHESFAQDDGLLTSRVPMTIFMVTTDPVVANNDCLLYFIADKKEASN